MTQNTYQARRARFLDAMGEGIAILPAAPEAHRNGDNHYLFRQDSDLFYLTGFAEPESIAVLRPGAEQPFLFFVRPRDKDKEIWYGRRAGVEGARSRYGADASYTFDQFKEMLPDLLKGQPKLFYRTGRHPALDRILQESLDGLRARNREGIRVPSTVVDPASLLHEMRLKKDPAELEVMRRVGELTARGHATGMRCTRPGMRESDLQAVIEYVFKRGGAYYVSYPSIVASGDNACILHYNENDAEMKDGDLVLVDAGAELDGYAGDITRTWPVNGKFTEPQRKVYQAVLDAQLEAIAAARPGVRFGEVHDVAVRALTRAMVSLGLLQGELDQLIQEGAYKRYYMHRTGHWIGMDVHDVGPYFESEGVTRLLEPGMIMTIEPGLYIAADDEQAPAELRGIGVRIEDDVLITESGHEILTGAVPKTIEEVERLMQEPAALPV